MIKVESLVGAVAVTLLVAACGGYSDLGQGPAQAGEQGMDSGTGGDGANGAKGGSSSLGGSMSPGSGGNMTPGMGGSMNPMGGSGGDMTPSMGGSMNPMGGSGGDTGPDCMTDEQCSFRGLCAMCPDGGLACPVGQCLGGHCTTTMPACDDGPCAGKSCGDACGNTDRDAAKCDANGKCVGGTPDCAPPALQCSTSMDCAAGVLICLDCGNDSCASSDCVDGQCTMLCHDGGLCETEMDCLAELPETACRSGGWVCAGGSCSRRLEPCAVPFHD